MPEEITEVYQDMDKEKRGAVVNAFAKHFGTRSISTVTRIFHLGNPLIVSWKDDDGQRYVKIHQGDAARMNRLANNHLTRSEKPVTKSIAV